MVRNGRAGGVPGDCGGAVRLELRELQTLILDCLDNRRETFQAGTARLNAVGHPGNRMAKHARGYIARCGGGRAKKRGARDSL